MSHYPITHVVHPVGAELVSKVTNTELALKLDAIKDETDKQSQELMAQSAQLRILTDRMNAIEVEAKVAKWLLRLLGAVFGSIVTYLIAHFRSK